VGASRWTVAFDQSSFFNGVPSLPEHQLQEQIALTVPALRVEQFGEDIRQKVFIRLEKVEDVEAVRIRARRSCSEAASFSPATERNCASSDGSGSTPVVRRNCAPTSAKKRATSADSGGGLVTVFITNGSAL